MVRVLLFVTLLCIYIPLKRTTRGEYEETGEGDEKPRTQLNLIVGGSVLAVAILLCLLYCACCRGGRGDARDDLKLLTSGEIRSRHVRARRRRSLTFSSGSSGSGSGKMRPMKMEAAEINMMEFANKGVLVMQDVKGEVKHVLDDEKSAAIERVQYDTGQNEIVTIGSNIEVLKSTSSAELVKEKSKMKDVEKAKSTEKTQPDKKTKSTEKPQPEKSVEKTKSTEKPQPGKRSKSPPKKRSKGARKKASKERK
ncbi:hypothetical protein Q1695_013235 [Nippostrongylus brasiliensis]|nr:hypothetical protein Q1695_013235 [Nippostrongylus brasiliensis]